MTATNIIILAAAWLFVAVPAVIGIIISKKECNAGAKRQGIGMAVWAIVFATAICLGLYFGLKYAQ